jgi:hypothetical protein
MFPDIVGGAILSSFKDLAHTTSSFLIPEMRTCGLNHAIAILDSTVEFSVFWRMGDEVVTITRHVNRESWSAIADGAGRQVRTRRTLSVGWDGPLCDYDFNHVLDLMVNSGAPIHIKDHEFSHLANRRPKARLCVHAGSRVVVPRIFGEMTRKD